MQLTRVLWQVAIAGVLLTLPLRMTAQSAPSACDGIDDRAEPTLCIWAPHPRLTVDRKSGHINLLVSAKLNRRFAAPVTVRFFPSGPANPSGVKLAQASAVRAVTQVLPPGREEDNILLLKVQTTEDNPTSGELTYYILADTDVAGAVILGSPLEVHVLTAP